MDASTTIASLSLDLDNKWSYLKTHGSSAWEGYPSYLDLVVPRILDMLRRCRLRISFFIVGRDALLPSNRDALASIAAAGHEIANHSFNHEPWLHLYSEDALERELAEAEEAIEQATGVRPRGFRGPGFSLSQATLRVLLRRGYDYDATVFPNLLSPLARAYFFAHSSLSKEEKRRRRALFGTLADALRPVKAFRWEIGEQRLLEIPVTTMPLLRLPFHFSYVMYLSKWTGRHAVQYFRGALGMCRLTGTQPSVLLHPLDFLGKEDMDDLGFFPGMDLPVELKLERVERMLEMLRERYRVVTMAEHAEFLAERPGMKTLSASSVVGA